jgi:sugar/nucleoside kinase (ribokinase family)
VGAGDAFCGGLLAHLWQAGVTGRAALDALDDDQWRDALTAAVTVAADVHASGRRSTVGHRAGPGVNGPRT